MMDIVFTLPFPELLNILQPTLSASGSFKVHLFQVDGVLTLGENIADNGGIKNSYQVRKKYLHFEKIVRNCFF